jgi:hypothetical protein
MKTEDLWAVDKSRWPEVHVTPVADLIEHASSGTTCDCLPNVRTYANGEVTVVRHHALDGREPF